MYRFSGNDRHAPDEEGEGERIILGFLSVSSTFLLMVPVQF